MSDFEPVPLGRALPPSLIADVEPVEVPETDLRETPEEAVARRSRALDARLGLYRVPARFAQARYADLTPEQNPHGRVSRWWEHGGATLLLVSETKGNGKTHAAYAVGNEVVRDPGVFTAAWSVVDLNDAIRPGGDQTAFDVACECELLILDDLGGERITEWTLERLHALVDYRWRAEKRTVVTTNLTGTEPIERYGERIIDRLIDGAWTVQVTGPSRRRPNPW